jgi:Na+:H+ antiporter, NhaA family
VRGNPNGLISSRSSARSAAVRGLVGPVTNFIGEETSSVALLLAATLAALVWANLSGSSYGSFWSTSANLDLGPRALHLDLRHWVNDALMAVFFFVVALEIRRELLRGELKDRATAALPVAAAIGGMIVPAAIYLFINAGQDSTHGWGIPMATDIAFALGVIALLGKRVPTSLRAFLLALAIVDDIGGIAVIALFYTADLALPWLGLAALAIAAAWALSAARVEAWWVYAAVACVTWFAVHESGVHATIAGVALALVIPQDPTRTASIHHAEDLLHPWTSFMVVPLFALANAGVVLTAGTLNAAATSPVAIGAAAGLIIGKPLGIVLFALVAVRAGIARRPTDVSWAGISGAAMVAGIGFTVAIFIATLAFDDPALVEEAKLGILFASAMSAAVGAGWLVIAPRRSKTSGADPSWD